MSTDRLVLSDEAVQGLREYAEARIAETIEAKNKEKNPAKRDQLTGAQTLWFHVHQALVFNNDPLAALKTIQYHGALASGAYNAACEAREWLREIINRAIQKEKEDE